MTSPQTRLFLVLLTSYAAVVLSCPPNCVLPDCRCWDNKFRPGNFSNDGTPQIVSLSFQYALNNETVQHYLPLFAGLQNPNGCPPKGTFFIQEKDTDVGTLKEVFMQGHEIALTSSDGKIPRDRKEWVESLFRSSEKPYLAGIPKEHVKGVRSPSLFMGGDDELEAEVQFGMSYESSCVTDNAHLLWPYTYDFMKNGPRCSLGLTPNRSFSGVWQFLMPMMSINGHKCATVGSCSPYIKTAEDAFTLFYNAFTAHYYHNRAPLVLFLDPQYLAKEGQVEGLRQFLQVIGRFKDTWIVTQSQALEWIRYPVPMYKTVKYLPWECPHH